MCGYLKKNLATIVRNFENSLTGQQLVVREGEKNCIGQNFSKKLVFGQILQNRFVTLAE
jgi:hypothetical protein